MVRIINLPFSQYLSQQDVDPLFAGSKYYFSSVTIPFAYGALPSSVSSDLNAGPDPVKDRAANHCHTRKQR